jgi:hypothetical protein
VPLLHRAEEAPDEVAALLLDPARVAIEELVEGVFVAGDQARRKDRGCGIEIVRRALDGFFGRSNRVADLEPRVPQWIEDPAERRGFDVGLGPDEEQQVDVGMKG